MKYLFVTFSFTNKEQENWTFSIYDFHVAFFMKESNPTFYGDNSILYSDHADEIQEKQGERQGKNWYGCSKEFFTVPLWQQWWILVWVQILLTPFFLEIIICRLVECAAVNFSMEGLKGKKGMFHKNENILVNTIKRRIL